MFDLPSYDTLDLEQDHDWLTIWLDRPKARNALSGEMIEELSQIFLLLKTMPDIRGITMRGRGGTFCAGGDIKGFKAILQGGGQNVADIVEVSCQIGTLFDLINEAPQVVVMLVEGAAMAGGLGIVCCGDVVVVTDESRFAMTETSIGIAPAQIAPFVVERLGLKVTRRLMLTASRFDGVEAQRIGLADYLVKDRTHMDQIEANIIKQVRKCAPGANAATKKIALATRHSDRPAMIELAGQEFAKCMLSDEGREGVASFLEKRKPYWAESPLEKEA